MPLIGGTNATGNGIAGDAANMQSAIYKCTGDSARILFCPAGKYLFDTTIYGETDLTINGVPGKTIFIADDHFAGNGNMFECIGKSNVTFENITFINNHSKSLNAFIQCKSSPNKCNNLRFINCTFTESWVQAAVMMGQTANKDSTHWNDNVLFDGCVFQQLYNPSYKVVTTEIPDSLKCVGINLQQTTLRCTIRNCIFKNTSGDGIYGYGANYGLRNNKYYGNWTIENCDFFRNWMNIEINGNYLGHGLNIHDNRFRYSTLNEGFNISVDSYRMRIENNDFLNADRAFIEFTSIGGMIKGNTGRLICWSDTSEGIMPTAMPSPRTEFTDLYGFNNLIEGNNFEEDRSHPNRYSPTEFNAFKLIERTGAGDTVYQPMSYKGITDYSAFWSITNNVITGTTHKVLDATNAKIRNVIFEGNTITTNAMVASPVEIWGYNWQITHNTWNLNGSPPPADGNAVVKVRDIQKDKTGSVMYDNNVFGVATWIKTLNQSLH